MFDVITIGGATRDVFFITSDAKVINKGDEEYLSFKYGSKIIPEEKLYTYGGGGANTAISFARLGLKTAAVLNIGAEGTGSLVLKELESAGVDINYVRRDKANHTGLSIVVSLKAKDHVMFLDRGANDFLEVPDWRSLKTRYFYLSSLTGESSEIIPELFSYASAHNIKIAWNPGSEQLKKGFYELEDYLEATDILILNMNESKELIFSRTNHPKLKTPEEVLVELYGMTGKTVVVTDGENGSFVYDGNKHFFHKSSGEKAVETTGAGDAFGSTFVASIIQGMSVEESMKFATLNAGSVVNNIGAQKGLMTFEQLRAKI